MTDRMQWLLLLAVLGLLVNVLNTVLILRKPKYVIPMGDIGPITGALKLVAADATKNQAATQGSILVSRIETRTAAAGIRQQMDNTEMAHDYQQRDTASKLNWLKAMIGRWFTVSPLPPPPDEPPPPPPPDPASGPKIT